MLGKDTETHLMLKTSFLLVETMRTSGDFPMKHKNREELYVDKMFDTYEMQFRIYLMPSQGTRDVLIKT